MISWTPFDERRPGNIGMYRIAVWACCAGPGRFEYVVGVWRRGSMNNVVMQRSGSLTVLNAGSFYSGVNAPTTYQRIDDSIPVTALDVSKTPGLTEGATHGPTVAQLPAPAGPPDAP
jgi:hypothetical protein